MSRWFRMYDEVLDDPKVQRLSGDDFKAWVNILCLASRNAGVLPPAADIAFALRLDGKKTAAVLSRLEVGGLIGPCETGVGPHKWNERQYKSDVSTDRVKRFRERSKPVSGTPAETPPDTDTDTEVPLDKNLTAVDPEKVAFDAGVKLLCAEGKSEGQARAIVGKWRKDHGPGQVIEALGAAQRNGVVSIIPWIEARWKATANNGYGLAHSGIPL